MNEQTLSTDTDIDPAALTPGAMPPSLQNYAALAQSADRKTRATYDKAAKRGAAHVVFADNDTSRLECLNCGTVYRFPLPLLVDHYVNGTGAFILDHEGCATRIRPDLPPVAHVAIDYDAHTCRCNRCRKEDKIRKGSVSYPREQFRLYALDFADVHRHCRDRSQLPPLPDVLEEVGQVTKATVWQLWFLSPTVNEWSKNNGWRVKVGPVSIWGHPTRLDALGFVAATSDRYDNYALRLRPSEITVTVGGPLEMSLNIVAGQWEDINAGDALLEIRRAASEVVPDEYPLEGDTAL